MAGGCNSRARRRVACLVAAGLSLAACDDDGSDTQPTATSVTSGPRARRPSRSCEHRRRDGTADHDRGRPGARPRLSRPGRRVAQRAGDRSGARAHPRRRRDQRRRRRARCAGGRGAGRGVGGPARHRRRRRADRAGRRRDRRPRRLRDHRRAPPPPRGAVAADLLGLGDGDVADRGRGRRVVRPHGPARRLLRRDRRRRARARRRRGTAARDGDDRGPRRRLRQRAHRGPVRRADGTRGRGHDPDLSAPAGDVPRRVRGDRRRGARPGRAGVVHRGAQPGVPDRHRRLPGRSDRRARRTARAAARRADLPERPHPGRRADRDRHHRRPGADGAARSGAGIAGPDRRTGRRCTTA